MLTTTAPDCGLPKSHADRTVQGKPGTSISASFLALFQITQKYQLFSRASSKQHSVTGPLRLCPQADERCLGMHVAPARLPRGLCNIKWLPSQAVSLPWGESLTDTVSLREPNVIEQRELETPIPAGYSMETTPWQVSGPAGDDSGGGGWRRGQSRPGSEALLLGPRWFSDSPWTRCQTARSPCFWCSWDPLETGACSGHVLPPRKSAMPCANLATHRGSLHLAGRTRLWGWLLGWRGRLRWWRG